MASKNKKDFTGAIVTINDNGEVIRTTPKSSNTSTTKTSSSSSNYVSTPTTKQTVTMPTLNKTNQSTNDKIALFNNANQSLQNKQVEKLNEQNKNGGLFKSGSSNFLEGYANTQWDNSLNIGKGFFQTLEGLADFLQYRASDSQKVGSQALEKIFGKNPVSDFYSGTSNWLKENAKFDSTGSLFGTNENAQDTLFGNQWRQDINEKSYLGDMGDSIGEGIGNIGAMAALSAVGGEALGAAGIGTTATGTLTTGGKLLLSGGTSYTSAYGNARSEAYKNGANDDEANKYATINGLAEAVSEQFFDAMPGIKSVGFADKIGVKDFLAKKIQSGIGSNTAKIFLRLAGGFEEGAEEMISNALTTIGSDLLHMVDQSYTYGMENNTGNPLEDGWNALFSEDSLKSFMSAGFTSAILGFGGDVLTSQQKSELINAYAKDNNISVEQATKQIEQLQLQFEEYLEAPIEQAPVIETETPQIQTNQQTNINAQETSQNVDTSQKPTKTRTQSMIDSVNTFNLQENEQTQQQKATQEKPKTSQKLEVRPTTKELSMSEQRKLDNIRQFRDAGMYASISKEEFLKNNYYPRLEKEIGLTREQAGEWFDNSKTKEYKQLSKKMNELYRNEEVEKYIPLEERGDLVFNAYNKNQTYEQMEQNLIKEINNRAGKEIVTTGDLETKPKGKTMSLQELQSKLGVKETQKQENEVKEKPKANKDNIAERKSDEVVKESIEKKTDNIVKKFDNAKKGDVFKRVEEKEGKPLRQGVKTITTATGTTQLVSDMDGSIITYEPLSNKKTLDSAYDRAKGKSLEQRYKENIEFIKSDKRITADKIADIETTLIDLKNEFNVDKNVDMFLDLVQQASTLGTTDAQALQFMSVIKKLSPETQLDTLIKMVEQSKEKGEKTFEGVELNKDLVKNVLEAQDDEVKFNDAMDELKTDIAKQMKVDFIERVNAFRFLSMLGNVKTHNRNMLGNGAMYELQSFKDTIGSIGESLYDKTSKALGGKGLQERTKATFGSLRASQEVRNFVNNKVDTFFKTQKNNSKYSESKSGMLNDIKGKRKMFTEATPIGKALNKLYGLNTKALDLEDKFFSKAMTKKAMKSYLVANGIKTDADIEANPELVARALDYAFFKGQEATYHQDSTTATAINTFKEKMKAGSGFSKLGGLAVESTMPFVKTPVNIAKTSLEYTPLIGTLDLRNQLKNAPKELRGAIVIDNFSKQFTGLALMGLGIALAKSGKIQIKGAGEGDKEDEIEKSLGNASYSIKIGDSTYDLSWLAPTSIPLFEGVELYNKFAKNGEIDANTLIDTMFGALDPVTDMSVLQSVERLASALGSNSKNKGNLQPITHIIIPFLIFYMSHILYTI